MELTSLDSLTDSQAAERLIKVGRNELPQSKQESFFNHFTKLLKEPMLLLLIAVGVLYLNMGDLGEGLMLGVSILVVIGISIYQERKSERALAALRVLSSPRALVIRNGNEKRIAAAEVVPGDLVILHEGDRVPADGIIIQSSHFTIDESLLTGESFPVMKKNIMSEKKPFKFESDESTESNKSNKSNEWDVHFKTFSSTLVVGGTALVRIIKTGIHTEVGKIGQSLQEVEPEELNLAKEIRQMVQLFAWSGVSICIAIIILYGFTHKDWMQAFLIGLATQMSLLPEEFPVVLTIFLAMGAWRLSKLQVLIRQPGSIERLGAVTVLCVDKTGTLTKNLMTVAELNNFKSSLSIESNSISNLPEEYHEVTEYGVLASHRNPYDPMEKAILRLVENDSWGSDHIHRDWEFIRDYPLSDKLMAMSCVWKDPNADSYIIASKGAPEAIIDLCHLDEIKTQQILAATQKMAASGLRILGVARAQFVLGQLPSNQHEFNFEWLGLIGLEDPLREEVPHAVQLCRRAGVRVIMMTGDYPETAINIAKRAGIQTDNTSLITGAELKALSDQELKQRLKEAHIFARMIPEQKLRIVQLLKNMGHVVAMTGDGVNDAPSLKWADIGISMGARGTDVAREASDIILLDDNFASIVAGVSRGRLIFSNIKKAMSYIVSIHVPIAGLSLLPVLSNSSLILLPIHIVFLELIIDPACSLMFESQMAEEGSMDEPPRSLNSRLFSLADLVRSIFQGALVLGVISAVGYYNTSINNHDSDHNRTLVFIVLSLSNIGLIFADMSGGSYRQLMSLFRRASNWIIVIAVMVCLFLLTQIASVRSLFHFGLLQPHEFISSIGIAFLIFLVINLWNWIVKARGGSSGFVGMAQCKEKRK